MDWSLVLASQGLEPIIDFSPEDGWGLIVHADVSQTALAAIRQYQIENRRWPWRREILQPGFLFDSASLGWVVLIGLFSWFDSRGINLRGPGMMDAAAVAHGQWWRLFTALWLHADIGHLAANATIGLVLLGLAMGRYGTGVGLLAACLAGAGGNIASWFFSSTPHYSLGASGLVMGCLGLIAVQSFYLWRRTPRAAKHILAGVSGGVFLFVLLGLTPGTDIAAHAGGFVCGLLLGSLLSQIPGLAQNRKANFLCGILFTCLVLWPWWLALRAGT
jgi:membrane associated rhomboid family serine protease